MNATHFRYSLYNQQIKKGEHMFWITSVFLFACQESDKSTETTEPVTNIEKKSEAPTTSAEKKSANKAQDFGAPFAITQAIPAKEVFADPEGFVGKTVRVEGSVRDVCQKMGCWMVISEGDKSMRITTKDHKFFVAKDGAGSTCHIEGEVVARDLDPERTAHFESESSKDAPIPEKEVKGDKTYEIVATSIRFIKE
jgi:hypothetical protein